MFLGAPLVTGLLLVISVALSAFPTSTARADEPGFPTFLDSLGEWRVAEVAHMQEYYRGLRGGDTSRVESGILGVARSRLYAKDLVGTLKWLQAHGGEIRSVPSSREQRQLTVRTLLAADASLDAVAFSRPFLESQDAIASSPEFARLAAIAEIREGYWERAASVLKGIPPVGETGRLAREHLVDLADTTSLVFKSPMVAGLLGIVPGAGYAYAGYGKSAISSFLVTSIFALATFQAFDADQSALGAFLGLLTVSWYGGSIYGGVTSTRRANLVKWDQFQEQFQP